jgi:hypothetical protein
MLPVYVEYLPHKSVYTFFRGIFNYKCGRSGSFIVQIIRSGDLYKIPSCYDAVCVARCFFALRARRLSLVRCEMNAPQQ